MRVAAILIPAILAACGEPPLEAAPPARMSRAVLEGGFLLDLDSEWFQPGRLEFDYTHAGSRLRVRLHNGADAGERWAESRRFLEAATTWQDLRAVYEGREFRAGEWRGRVLTERRFEGEATERLAAFDGRRCLELDLSGATECFTDVEGAFRILVKTLWGESVPRAPWEERWLAFARAGRFAEASADPDARVRVRAVARLADECAAPPLPEDFEPQADDPSPAVRSGLARLAGLHLDRPRLRGFLEQARSDACPVVRAEVVRAAASRARTDEVERAFFEPLVEDPHPAVRRAARDALDLWPQQD